MKQKISTIAGLILGTIAALVLADVRDNSRYTSHMVTASAIVEKVAMTSSSGRVVPSTRP